MKWRKNWLCPPFSSSECAVERSPKSTGATVFREPGRAKWGRFGDRARTSGFVVGTYLCDMPLKLHPDPGELTYAEVLLPLPLRSTYTYAAPPPLADQLAFGKRVEVPFGKKKLYAGLVIRTFSQRPAAEGPFKPILSVIDERPIIHPMQWAFWQWLAEYYMCTPGEVMHAALPAHLKLSSETRVVLTKDLSELQTPLSDKEYLIAEALSVQSALRLQDIQAILQQQTVYPLIHRMMQRGLVRLEEELKDPYKPRQIHCVHLRETYKKDPEQLHRAFKLTAKSERQTRLLLAFLDLLKKRTYVRQSELLKRANSSHAVLKALCKKGILEIKLRTISRLQAYEGEQETKVELSSQQKKALQTIRQILLTAGEKAPKPVLLHGITGSGKTRVYIELMRQTLAQGKQVLYLLPEIALTTQIVQRLQKVFGSEVLVYHSRLNNNQRVELWQSVYQGKGVVLGARSALFLPFSKLGLIIVDEEHEQAYKQQEPAPRYHGRDAAIYLAHKQKAAIILGSATPSLESLHHARQGKYALVEMKERHGTAVLPRIEIIPLREEAKKGPAHLSQSLTDAIRQTIERGEQVILFQNRRGYAPAMRCETCGWIQQCFQCDLSLTYHKYRNEMQCHYCGYYTKLPTQCPHCGSVELRLQGFGTEKIEDELKIYFPELRIQRMDYDTVRGKNSYTRILGEFDEGQIEVLVGTQMVTKGLDFENVGLVGIISADQLLHFPDFRATERAYQLMVQVAGRAGRKEKQGRVLIQAINTSHPVLREVQEHDQASFYQRELAERRDFFYPPFSRLLRITLRHRKAERVNQAARLFAERLQPVFQEHLIGPAVPHVGRIRGQYLIQMIIKLPLRASHNAKVKRWLIQTGDFVRKQQGLSGLYIIYDVDPV